MSKIIGCDSFPCPDVDKSCYKIPDIEIEPSGIRTLMISEAPPRDLSDYFYANNLSFYFQTTAQAFSDAGVHINSIPDLLRFGVYVTTAIKCGKIAYAISPETVDSCSCILKKEIDLFPNAKSILLMGDTAIKSVNYVTKNDTGKRIIPSGSTYKIRKNKYFYRKARVFPSYLQTGKSYLIERSKRKMIAEDIKAALECSWSSTLDPTRGRACPPEQHK